MSEIMDDMPEEDYEYSIASQLAYDYYDNGYNNELTQDKLDSMIEGYELDTELSNDLGVVIRRTDNNSAIVAYRGTRDTNDIIADTQMALGLDTFLPLQTRFSRANDLYTITKNKYGNVDLTGHSIGGYLSDYIGRINNEKTVAFNVGLSPLALYNMPSVGNIKPRIYDTDNFDLISHTTHFPSYQNQVNMRIITQSQRLDELLGSHSLDNFLPRERVIRSNLDTNIASIYVPTAYKRLDRTANGKEKESSNILTKELECADDPFKVCKKPKLKYKKSINQLA